MLHTPIATFEKVSDWQFIQDSEGLMSTPQLVLEELTLPKRATSHSAGYDFVSPVTFIIEQGTSVKIPTGVRCRMAEDWVLVLVPRSSLGFKGLTLANTMGVIDSDYYNADNEGHIMLKLVNNGDAPICINEGDRIVQGIFLPYGLATEEEVKTERVGGTGSSGK